MKCEKCGKEFEEGILIEIGSTPEEQTANHIHLCKNCGEEVKTKINEMIK